MLVAPLRSHSSTPDKSHVSHHTSAIVGTFFFYFSNNLSFSSFLFLFLLFFLLSSSFLSSPGLVYMTTDPERSSTASHLPFPICICHHDLQHRLVEFKIVNTTSPETRPATSQCPSQALRKTARAPTTRSLSRFGNNGAMKSVPRRFPQHRQQQRAPGSRPVSIAGPTPCRPPQKQLRHQHPLHRLYLQDLQLPLHPPPQPGPASPNQHSTHTGSMCRHPTETPLGEVFPTTYRP